MMGKPKIDDDGEFYIERRGIHPLVQAALVTGVFAVIVALVGALRVGSDDKPLACSFDNAVIQGFYACNSTVNINQVPTPTEDSVSTAVSMTLTAIYTPIITLPPSAIPTVVTPFFTQVPSTAIPVTPSSRQLSSTANVPDSSTWTINVEPHTLYLVNGGDFTFLGQRLRAEGTNYQLLALYSSDNNTWQITLEEVVPRGNLLIVYSFNDQSDIENWVNHQVRDIVTNPNSCGTYACSRINVFEIRDGQITTNYTVNIS